MTADVFTVSPEQDVLAAQQLMYDKNIRHVPVVGGDGLLAGLVSDRDLLRRAVAGDELPLTTQQAVLRALKVRDVMTGDVETVDVDDDLATAARLMLENKYGCVPVLEEGLLAGILTEADFVRLAADDAAVGS
jgi:CBS domain-containing protein